MRNFRCTGDRGESTIEALIWLPVIVGLFLVAALAWQITGAHAEVEESAQAAARAASLERHPSGATVAGNTAALASLPVGSDVCEAANVAVDVSEWYAGWVSVTVTCTVDTSGPGVLLNVAGSREISHTWTEPVDPARTVGG